MTNPGSRLVDAGVFLCAFLLTAVLVHREFFDRPTEPSRRPVAVANWDEIMGAGNRIGGVDAPVTIVEFSDFQCPYCAQFALDVLRPARRGRPGDVALIYRHWPLSIHSHAFDAAIASECAAAQGRFEPFHDALFAGQDSIGLLPFEHFAADAGVPDIAAFKACRADGAIARRVERDRDLARAIGARGTPTFVVNGYLMRAPLDSARLDSIIRAARR